MNKKNSHKVKFDPYIRNLRKELDIGQKDLAKKYSDRLVGLSNGKIIFDEKSENINKSNL
tara:strand:+ start:107 stop:286 length:180 start_codon:yes stop_codon:yes gene_type:complete